MCLNIVVAMWYWVIGSGGGVPYNSGDEIRDTQLLSCPLVTAYKGLGGCAKNGRKMCSSLIASLRSSFQVH